MVYSNENRIAWEYDNGSPKLILFDRYTATITNNKQNKIRVCRREMENNSNSPHKIVFDLLFSSFAEKIMLAAKAGITASALSAGYLPQFTAKPGIDQPTAAKTLAKIAPMWL